MVFSKLPRPQLVNYQIWANMQERICQTRHS